MSKKDGVKRVGSKVWVAGRTFLAGGLGPDPVATIWWMHRDYQAGVPTKEIAKPFNMSAYTVSLICRRLGPARKRGGRQLSRMSLDARGTRLTVREVLEIRARIAKEASNVKLARDYGVTCGTICDIRHGRTWRWLKSGLTSKRYRIDQRAK